MYREINANGMCRKLRLPIPKYMYVRIVWALPCCQLLYVCSLAYFKGYFACNFRGSRQQRSHSVVWQRAMDGKGLKEPHQPNILKNFGSLNSIIFTVWLGQKKEGINQLFSSSFVSFFSQTPFRRNSAHTALTQMGGKGPCYARPDKITLLTIQYPQLSKMCFKVSTSIKH